MDDILAYQALLHNIDFFLGQLPESTWKHPQDCSRSRWLDQICSDNYEVHTHSTHTGRKTDKQTDGQRVNTK